MPRADPLVSVRGVTKNYSALRPLRIAHLEVAHHQSAALLGLDRAAAEVLTNLLTGATVPDSGEITVFGRSTRDIADSAEWLAWLDRFGILTDRAVLLDQLTAEQNLAMPFTLDVDELTPSVQSEVAALAAEVGLAGDELRSQVAALEPLAKLRLRLARALALRPTLLIAEHPTASLPPDAVPAFAADLSAITARRMLTMVMVTTDATFASAVAQSVLTLQPASGELKRTPGWRRWFS